jgi:hypothetical protein
VWPSLWPSLSSHTQAASGVPSIGDAVACGSGGPSLGSGGGMSSGFDRMRQGPPRGGVEGPRVGDGTCCGLTLAPPM